jgi:hypothetical protein
MRAASLKPLDALLLRLKALLFCLLHLGTILGCRSYLHGP